MKGNGKFHSIKIYLFFLCECNFPTTSPFSLKTYLTLLWKCLLLALWCLQNLFLFDSSDLICHCSPLWTFHSRDASFHPAAFPLLPLLFSPSNPLPTLLLLLLCSPPYVTNTLCYFSFTNSLVIFQIPPSRCNLGPFSNRWAIGETKTRKTLRKAQWRVRHLPRGKSTIP